MTFFTNQNGNLCIKLCRDFVSSELAKWICQEVEQTHTRTHLLEASSSLEGECWWLFDMVLWADIPKSPKITSKPHCDGFDLFINDRLQRRCISWKTARANLLLVHPSQGDLGIDEHIVHVMNTYVICHLHQRYNATDEWMTCFSGPDFGQSQKSSSHMALCCTEWKCYNIPSTFLRPNPIASSCRNWFDAELGWSSTSSGWTISAAFGECHLVWYC